MLDRDDDGYNSPEGNGISEEGQRRKAALAQLTVDVDGDGGVHPKKILDSFTGSLSLVQFFLGSTKFKFNRNGAETILRGE